MVEELAGGMVVVMWRKLSSWLDTVSEEQFQPSWAEWFQLLAKQLIAVEGRAEPVHLRGRKQRRHHRAITGWAN